MAEYWIDYENGSEANNGLSPAAPKKFLPLSAGSTIVAANGDIYNMRNGVTWPDARQNGVRTDTIWRGYGLASNVLYVRQVSPQYPTGRPVRIVREAGVHEGMWTMDQRGSNVGGAALQSSTQSNITIEDCHIIGPTLVGLAAGMNFGNNSAPGTGANIRRCHIELMQGAGITGYQSDVLVENCKVEKVGTDCLYNNAHAANAFQAGKYFRVLGCEIRNPNWDFTTNSEGTQVLGDICQMASTTWQWDGAFRMENCYVWKEGPGKQFTVIPGGVGSFLYRNLYVGGGGNLSMAVGHLDTGSSLLIENVIIDQYQTVFGCPQIALARFNPKDTSPPAFAWNTGSSVILRNINWLGGNCPGLVGFAGGQAATYSFNGSVLVEGCTVKNAVNLNDNLDNAQQQLASTFSMFNVRTTIGAQFQATIRNNILNVTGRPQQRMPIAGLNSAQWVFQNNNYGPDASFIAEGNTYMGVANFQAATNQAVNNLALSPTEVNLTPTGAVRQGSPMIAAGRHVNYTLDSTGLVRWNPPSIGAQELIRLRTLRV